MVKEKAVGILCKSANFKVDLPPGRRERERERERESFIRNNSP